VSFILVKQKVEELEEEFLLQLTLNIDIEI
jgi:hypothetical protein